MNKELLIAIVACILACILLLSTIIVCICFRKSIKAAIDNLRSPALPNTNSNQDESEKSQDASVTAKKGKTSDQDESEKSQDASVTGKKDQTSNQDESEKSQDASVTGKKDQTSLSQDPAQLQSQASEGNQSLEHASGTSVNISQDEHSQLTKNVKKATKNNPTLESDNDSDSSDVSDVSDALESNDDQYVSVYEKAIDDHNKIYIWNNEIINKVSSTLTALMPVIKENAVPPYKQDSMINYIQLILSELYGVCIFYYNDHVEKECLSLYAILKTLHLSDTEKNDIMQHYTKAVSSTREVYMQQMSQLLEKYKFPASVEKTVSGVNSLTLDDTALPDISVISECWVKSKYVYFEEKGKFFLDHDIDFVFWVRDDFLYEIQEKSVIIPMRSNAVSREETKKCFDALSSKLNEHYKVAKCTAFVAMLHYSTYASVFDENKELNPYLEHVLQGEHLQHLKDIKQCVELYDSGKEYDFDALLGHCIAIFQHLDDLMKNDESITQNVHCAVMLNIIGYIERQFGTYVVDLVNEKMCGDRMLWYKRSIGFTNERRANNEIMEHADLKVKGFKLQKEKFLKIHNDNTQELYTVSSLFSTVMRDAVDLSIMRNEDTEIKDFVKTFSQLSSEMKEREQITLLEKLQSLDFKKHFSLSNEEGKDNTEIQQERLLKLIENNIMPLHFVMYNILVCNNHLQRIVVVMNVIVESYILDVAPKELGLQELYASPSFQQKVFRVIKNALNGIDRGRKNLQSYTEKDNSSSNEQDGGGLSEHIDIDESPVIENPFIEKTQVSRECIMWVSCIEKAKIVNKSGAMGLYYTIMKKNINSYQDKDFPKQGMPSVGHRLKQKLDDVANMKDMSLECRVACAVILQMSQLGECCPVRNPCYMEVMEQISKQSYDGDEQDDKQTQREKKIKLFIDNVCKVIESIHHSEKLISIYRSQMQIEFGVPDENTVSEGEKYFLNEQELQERQYLYEQARDLIDDQFADIKKRVQDICQDDNLFLAEKRYMLCALNSSLQIPLSQLFHSNTLADIKVTNGEDDMLKYTATTLLHDQKIIPQLSQRNYLHMTLLPLFHTRHIQPQGSMLKILTKYINTQKEVKYAINRDLCTSSWYDQDVELSDEEISKNKIISYHSSKRGEEVLQVYSTRDKGVTCAADNTKICILSPHCNTKVKGKMINGFALGNMKNINGILDAVKIIEEMNSFIKCLHDIDVNSLPDWQLSYLREVYCGYLHVITHSHVFNCLNLSLVNCIDDIDVNKVPVALDASLENKTISACTIEEKWTLYCMLSQLSMDLVVLTESYMMNDNISIKEKALFNADIEPDNEDDIGTMNTLLSHACMSSQMEHLNSLSGQGKSWNPKLAELQVLTLWPEAPIEYKFVLYHLYSNQFLAPCNGTDIQEGINPFMNDLIPDENMSKSQKMMHIFQAIKVVMGGKKGCSPISVSVISGNYIFLSALAALDDHNRSVMEIIEALTKKEKFFEENEGQLQTTLEGMAEYLSKVYNFPATEHEEQISEDSRSNNEVDDLDSDSHHTDPNTDIGTSESVRPELSNPESDTTLLHGKGNDLNG